MVAEGLTNKEIGQRLFISERTAEGHVEQIRNKLGFHTRSQVAAWVAADKPSALPTPPPHAAVGPKRDSKTARRWLWWSGGTMAAAAVVILLAAQLLPRLTEQAPGPRIDTFAGDGSSSVSPDGGLARSTSLAAPNGVLVDRTGGVYIADGNRIRIVGSDGRVSTVAGTGAGGFNGDQGLALTTMLQIASRGAAELTGMALDAKGNLFVSDSENDRVREVTPDGKLVTVAGAGAPGHSLVRPNPADIGDGGPGVAALLAHPRGLAIDALGNLYIADSGDNRVRRLDASGVITTFAGTGQIGWTGDGGPAAQAELSAPEGLAFDAEGDLYIADTGNERIRKVKDGVITTVAGDGSSDFRGDGGAGPKASLNVPLGVAVDARGNVYIADTGNLRIRRLDVSLTITTVAGNGDAAFSGDSRDPASAALNLPVAVAIGNSGELYIADSGNNRVRIVRSLG